MVNRDYYICRTKRPYTWFDAHMRKWELWPMRLHVYRCPYRELGRHFHLTKQRQDVWY